MALVVTGAFIGSFGAVLLKAGAGRLARSVRSVITNWPLGLGVFLYALSSVFFVLANTKGELTILYPLVSLGYLWTLLWARLFFNEPLTKFKFLGIGLILVGVCFLKLSSG
jgi:undecaprenyl phosphate-alpha-L-ara4N flippase subunit ArnE